MVSPGDQREIEVREQHEQKVEAVPRVLEVLRDAEAEPLEDHLDVVDNQEDQVGDHDRVAHAVDVVMVGRA